MMMMSPSELRGAALLVMAVGQTLFALLYLTFPWWKTFLGRALFFKAMAFAVLLDLGLWARHTELPSEDRLFAGLYCLLAVGVWTQLAAFLSVRTSHNARNQFPDDDGMTDGQVRT